MTGELPQDGDRELKGEGVDLLAEVAARQRSERELRRVRESFSFQLGSHLVSSVKRPWRILLLPITLSVLMIKKIRKKAEREAFVVEEKIQQNGPRRNSVVFFPQTELAWGISLGYWPSLGESKRLIRKRRLFSSQPCQHFKS